MQPLPTPPSPFLGPGRSPPPSETPGPWSPQSPRTAPGLLPRSVGAHRLHLGPGHLHPQHEGQPRGAPRSPCPAPLPAPSGASARRWRPRSSRVPDALTVPRVLCRWPLAASPLAVAVPLASPCGPFCPDAPAHTRPLFSPRRRPSTAHGPSLPAPASFTLGTEHELFPVRSAPHVPPVCVRGPRSSGPHCPPLPLPCPDHGPPRSPDGAPLPPAGLVLGHQCAACPLRGRHAHLLADSQPRTNTVRSLSEVLRAVSQSAVSALVSVPSVMLFPLGECPSLLLLLSNFYQQAQPKGLLCCGSSLSTSPESSPSPATTCPVGGCDSEGARA